MKETLADRDNVLKFVIYKVKKMQGAKQPNSLKFSLSSTSKHRNRVASPVTVTPGNTN